MFCDNCGTKLNQNDKFCSQCGKNVENQIKAETENLETEKVLEETTPEQTNNEIKAEVEEKKWSGKSITGFVLSLCGIVFLELTCAIIGLIFSAIALGDIKRNNYAGKGLAISGLAISITATCISFFTTINTLISFFSYFI